MLSPLCEKFYLYVSFYLFRTSVSSYFKVPDAFQQKLSAEKTPTLCNALPSFDAMVRIWQEQQRTFEEPFSTVIQKGIDKLDAYREIVQLVPAYTISMSERYPLINRSDEMSSR